MTTYILGNGGFATELFDQVFSNDSNDFGGFIILNNNTAYVNGIHGVTLFDYNKKAKFILGVGKLKVRSLFLSHFLTYYDKTLEHFPNIIDSRAYIAKNVELGIGNVVCPFASITASAILGNFNMLNIYSSVTHNCVIGSYNVFSPYASIMGNCVLGDSNFLGANSTIIPSKNIGNDNTISAGECLFDNMTNREFFQSGLVMAKR